MEKFRLEDAFSMLKEIDNEETKAGNLNESLITEAKGDSDDKEDDIDVRELSWDTDWELSDNDADVKEEEIEDEDDVVGKVILNCPICQSKIFKSDDELEFSESENLYNTDEECPFCQTVGGFKMCGRVIPFDEEEDDKEEDKAKEDIEDTAKDEVKDETDEEEVVIEEEEEVEESLSEACEDGFCKDGDLEDGKSINVVDEENESCNEAVEDEDANLPSSMEIPVGEFCNALDIPTSELEDACAEELANYISDSFGYCINSLEFEVDGDTIRVSDIDWDLSESCGAKKRQITNEAIDDDMSISDEIKDEVEDILDASEEEVQEEAGDSQVFNCAKDVMTAYQNANKWLDSVKEVLYTDIGCVFFSSYIHNLAHTMPVRFDNFGDILHTVNMKIPYPSTQEIVEEPHTVPEALSATFEALDAIKKALNEFIKCTEDEYHGMSCAAETLLNDIEGEYPMLYRMQRAYDSCDGDLVKFDKWVNQYVNNKDNLTESLNEAATDATAEEMAEGPGVADGWKQDGNDWFFRKSGKVVTNQWVKHNNDWYYVGADGKMLKNTTTPDGYTVDASGKYVKAGANNTAAANNTQQVQQAQAQTATAAKTTKAAETKAAASDEYKSGTVQSTAAKNGWNKVGDEWYYFKNGKMLKDATTPDGYYVDAQGVWDGGDKEEVEEIEEVDEALNRCENSHLNENADGEASPAPNTASTAGVGKLAAGNLKSGTQDTARVKALQMSLTNAGFNCPVTGAYDDATVNAVKEFQQKNGLTVDGIYGNQTANALNQAIAGKKSASGSGASQQNKYDTGINNTSGKKTSNAGTAVTGSAPSQAKLSATQARANATQNSTSGQIDSTKYEQGKKIANSINGPYSVKTLDKLSANEKALYDYYVKNKAQYEANKQNTKKVAAAKQQQQAIANRGSNIG